MNDKKPDQFRDDLSEVVDDLTSLPKRGKWSDIQKVAAALMIGLFVNLASFPLAAIFNDPGLAVLGGAVGSLAMTVAVIHVMRRLLLPHVDMKEAWHIAKRNPIAIAIYALGVLILMSSMLLAAAIAASRQFGGG